MPKITGPTKVQRGKHMVTVIIGTGTASLKAKVADAPSFQPLTDASWSSSIVDNIDIAECDIDADLTGDAQVFVDFVSD